MWVRAWEQKTFRDAFVQLDAGVGSSEAFDNLTALSQHGQSAMLTGTSQEVARIYRTLVLAAYLVTGQEIVEAFNNLI